MAAILMLILAVKEQELSVLLDHARKFLLRRREPFDFNFEEFLQGLVIGIRLREKTMGIRGVDARRLDPGFYRQGDNGGIRWLAAGGDRHPIGKSFVELQ